MDKIKKAWHWISGESSLAWMWLKNFCFVFLTTKSQFRIFMGYGHWWFARRYADKRARISRINKVCGGKRHYVLPFGEYTLVVINKLELNMLKSKHIVSKNLNVNEIFKQAYYLTK